MLLAMLLVAGLQATPSEKILHDVQAKMASAQTIHLHEREIFMGRVTSEMEVTAKKPNLFRFEAPPAAHGKNAVFSDGITTYSIQDGRYGVTTFDPSKYVGVGVNSFFGPDYDWQVVSKDAEKTDFQGKPALAVALHRNGEKGPIDVRLMIDPQTTLPEGYTQEFPQGTAYVQYADLQLNGEVDGKSFMQSIEAVSEAPGSGRPSLDGALIPVGAQAPGFSATTPWGDQISLASALQGKKALILNFWFYGWHACREEFPRLQQLYAQLQNQGLALVAVNYFDPPGTIQKYYNANGFAFPPVMNGQGENNIAKNFGVRAYPTNYVIAPDGTVVARFVGYNEKGIREALKRLGVE